MRFSSRLFLILLGAIPLIILPNVTALKAASSLAAWKLGSDGVLKLRTSVGAKLQAFFQYGELGKGDRIWIDFPGELIRPRKLVGSGPVNQIRVGKPQDGITRLVVEFNKSISIDPKRLKLVGTSSNQWEMNLVGLPVSELHSIGEGNLVKSPPPLLDSTSLLTSNEIASISEMPKVTRGRYRVVIDPGHGGPDPGAVGIRGIRETDVVLDISIQVAQILKEEGVKVTLTRRSEVDLDLPPRVEMANRLRADVFVSIHANASKNTRRDVNGIETFFFTGSQGQKLATLIQKEVLMASPGSPDRGVRRSRFFVIRRTHMPAALVETGFLTGRIDSSRLARSTYRRKLAIAISRGILFYLQEG